MFEHLNIGNLVPLPYQKSHCLILIFLASSCSISHANVRLPKVFADNMVLQREQPIHIWGWADTNELVSVRLNDVEAHSVTNSLGEWSVTLPALPAGGPYDLLVRGANEIRLVNIMMGDVWICSGQSNMQWQVHQTPYHEMDTAFISKNQIRLLTVQIDMDYMPRKDIKGGNWKNLTSKNINYFSAVAYHFGKSLHDTLSVPIGLISVNLGATSIETWMSNEALLAFPQFQPDVLPIVEAGKNFHQVKVDLKKRLPDWEKEYYLKGPGISENWQLPGIDDTDWMDYTGHGSWEKNGLPNHDGAVWFRTTFDVPEDYQADSFNIPLSQIDDYDITWVNGHQVGKTFGRHNHRNYTFPTSLVKSKDNVLVVRAFDIGGQGGFTTSPFWTSNIVRGPWKMKAGLSIAPDQIEPLFSVNATPFSSPCVLFNANIAPLTDLNIKGVIWYQGEANVERAVEYSSLFPALIQDWRNHWKAVTLPFLYVQLANYGAEVLVPGPSTWAELREAQDQALELPMVGRAISIDIGEANDIHPKNKIDVGRRLALAGLKLAYHQSIIYSGPIFEKVNFEKDAATVFMDAKGAGLVTKNKYGYVHGFAIAGSDRKFYWAKAEIMDGKIKVWSPAVDRPKSIRYAWSNNPGLLDLYNEEGLPAAPFRTDNWPLTTSENQYDAQKARF